MMLPANEITGPSIKLMHTQPMMEVLSSIPAKEETASNFPRAATAAIRPIKIAEKSKSTRIINGGIFFQDLLIITGIES